MDYKKYGKTSLGIILILVTVSIFCYSNIYKNSNGEFSVVAQHNAAYNMHLLDSSMQYLKDGDIALRNGIDVTSNVLRQMNRQDKNFSHCGVVMIEHGYPFVYHCIGGEDNPDAMLRRDSAQTFFSPANNMAFGFVRMDVNKKEKGKLLETVKGYYRKRIKFDMDFDLKSNDRFYCTEMVYKALRIATADSNYIGTTDVAGFRYVSVDNITCSKHATLICLVKYK